MSSLPLGVLGLLVGSFLNVCIHRLPRDQSVVSPPSHCPACGTPLRWYHNVPVVSWLVLGRRVRFCRAPISWRYPLVELLTAALFVAARLVCSGRRRCSACGWRLRPRSSCCS